MSELLKKQKFGVEVEFTGITRTMAAEAVAEILGSHAAGPDRTCYRTYTIRDSKRRIWKVMRDSSICPVRKAGRELMDEYRVEFVTPPLNYEDIEALQTIIRKFKELGGVSHSSSVIDFVLIPCLQGNTISNFQFLSSLNSVGSLNSSIASLQNGIATIMP